MFQNSEISYNRKTILNLHTVKALYLHSDGATTEMSSMRLLIRVSLLFRKSAKISNVYVHVVYFCCGMMSGQRHFSVLHFFLL